MIRYFQHGTNVVFTTREGGPMSTVTYCESAEYAIRMAAGLQAKLDRLTAAQRLTQHRVTLDRWSPIR